MRDSVTRSMSSRRGRQARTGGRGHVWALLLTLVLLLGAALGRIYLERRTAGLMQDWNKERRLVETLEKERDNLLMERESYTHGNYILARARDMGLTTPIPGQVRRLTPGQVVTDPATNAVTDRR